mmetsp:Transcript_36809/g.90895  ORF Transcript_36809/g.90895 Transcript_36809/m.90895 type:complete len:210 (-) Transcript_36809:629-1258(-)
MGFSSIILRTDTICSTSRASALSADMQDDTREMMNENMNPPSSITMHAMRRSDTVWGTTLPYPTVVRVCTAQNRAATYSSQCSISFPAWSSRSKLYTLPYRHAIQCESIMRMTSSFIMVTVLWYCSSISWYRSKMRTAFAMRSSLRQRSSRSASSWRFTAGDSTLNASGGHGSGYGVNCQLQFVNPCRSRAMYSTGRMAKKSTMNHVLK